MSDTTINRFVASGTAAQRVAFTPAPATPSSGPSPLCIWYETDTGDTYLSANAATWVLLTANALNVLPWKRPCRAKTTGALAANTYANGTAGVGATLTANANGALAAQDGVTLVAGERLLVANEVAGLGNGIYTVTQVGTGGTPYILTRATDANNGTGLVNATTSISEGTAADQQWQCTTNAAITVGTTAQVWAQVSSGSFTAASTTEQLTGTSTTKGATPDSVAALWEQGADVASSGTISLDEGGYFHVTGTTTITDIDFTTDKAGRTAWVEFTGILTLTHNASTLILPTGANITTAAGDTACFVSEGSDVIRCVAYNRASGAALVGAASGPAVLGSATGTGASGVITISGLSGSYTDIEIRILGRTTAAVSTSAVALTVNAVAAGYDQQLVYGVATSAVASESLNGANIPNAFLVPGTSATAGFPGGGVLTVQGYAQTAIHKLLTGLNRGPNSNTTGSGFAFCFSGVIRMTAAITSVTLTLASGNFTTDTIVRVIGIP